MTDGSIRVEATLWPDDAPQKALRQIALGMRPLILLEVDLEGEEDVVYRIDGSLLNSYEEVIELLDSFREVLQASLDQQATLEQEESDDE